MAMKKGQQQGRPAPSDALSARVKASGMIQPGSKPQFDRATPLDKVVAAAKAAFGKKKKGK